MDRVAAPPGHGLLPVEPDADSAPYWAGLAEDRLTLPRCRSCRRTWSPPSPRCPHCGAAGRDWVEVDGRGSVYSWVVVHRAMDEAFADAVPYTIAVVELAGADGARLLGRVLSDPREPPFAGMAVRTVVYEVDGQPLPGFVVDEAVDTASSTTQPQGTREGKPA